MNVEGKGRGLISGTVSHTAQIYWRETWKIIQGLIGVRASQTDTLVRQLVVNVSCLTKAITKIICM